LETVINPQKGEPVSRIIHFELPVDDAARAGTFYREVFGWEVQNPDDDENYWLVTTGTEEPGIDGAFIARQHAAQLVNIIGVDSLDDSLVKARAAGAELVRDKEEIPGVGIAAYVKDTEGNTVGLFQPAQSP
jgi:uncharacterized protein